MTKLMLGMEIEMVITAAMAAAIEALAAAAPKSGTAGRMAIIVSSETVQTELNAVAAGHAGIP